MTEMMTANLPAVDFDRTEAFYHRLGFQTQFKDAGWMILQRGAFICEFFPYPGLDPYQSSFSACLRTQRLDALYADWAGLDLPVHGIPRLRPPGVEAPGLRIGYLVDVDGSLLRLIEADPPLAFEGDAP